MIPDWRDCLLGDVITLQRGFDLPERERVQGDVPIVSSSGTTGYHNTYKVKAPGVVTGRYGTLGEIHYVTRDFWPLNTTLYVKDFKGNFPLFVAYFLRTLNLPSQNAAGAVPGVNRNHLHMLKVRIPPVPTQRTIASILSVYDDLIANNNRRIGILEAMAQAIYREWFVEFRFPGHEKVKLVDSPLGKIPEGWRRQLGDVVTLKRGYDLPQRERTAGDVPLVSSSGITDFHDKALVEGPGVVTGRYGTLGEVFYIPRSFWPLNTTLYVRDFHDNEPLLVVHLLRSLHLASQNAAGAVPGVNRNALHLLDVVFPPIELQKRIAPDFNAIERCCATLRSKNANLHKTRDLLLPKLMSGQLDVECLGITVGEQAVAGIA